MQQLALGGAFPSRARPLAEARGLIGRAVHGVRREDDGRLAIGIGEATRALPPSADDRAGDAMS